MTYLDSIIHGHAVTPLDRTTRALMQAGVSVEHYQASPQMSAVIDAAWDLPLTLDSAVWLIGVALTMADDLARAADIDGVNGLQAALKVAARSIADITSTERL